MNKNIIQCIAVEISGDVTEVGQTNKQGKIVLVSRGSWAGAREPGLLSRMLLSQGYWAGAIYNSFEQSSWTFLLNTPSEHSSRTLILSIPLK